MTTVASRKRGFPKRFKAGLSSKSTIKIRACELTEKILSLMIELQTHKSRSRVSRQPDGYEEIRDGALNRAIEVLAELGDTWLVISIENGKEDILGLPYDVPFIFIKCRNQAAMEAWGLPFPIPMWLWERVIANNSEIGDEVPSQDHDPMAWFTNGGMDRAEICAWGLVMAFMPLIYTERYSRPVKVDHTSEEITAFMARAIFKLPEYDAALEDVTIGSESGIKLEALSLAHTDRSVHANIVPYKVEPLYTVQPVGYASIHQEALHRASTACALYVAEKGRMPLFSQGVQTGIVLRRKIPYEIACCVTIARDGRITVTWGMPVRLPEWLWHEYLDGKTLQNGEPWEVGLRIAELDLFCLHNTLLYLSEAEIKDTQGRTLDRTFLLWQVMNLGLLQHQNRDRYKGAA